jgi:hypothetical protein
MDRVDDPTRVPHGPFFGRFWTIFACSVGVCPSERKWARIAPLAFSEGQPKEKLPFGEDPRDVGFDARFGGPRRLTGPKHGEHVARVQSDLGTVATSQSCSSTLGRTFGKMHVRRKAW